MSARGQFRFGLRGRLVAAITAVLVGLLAVTAALVVLRSNKAMADIQQTRFAVLTRQLAETVGYPVLARSPALLEPHLDAFARTPDLIAVEVRDDWGEVLATRHGAASMEGVEVPLHRRVEVRTPVRTAGTAPGDDEGELAMFGLSDEAPRLVGHVTATFSTEATARIQQRVRRDIIAAFVVGGSLVLLVVLLLSSSVVQRARRLAQAADRVAHGDLTVQVEDRSNDELSDLARDFNVMTASLSEQRQALDDAADKLAEREALSAIGRATAVIAHELKNPLGILLGAAQIVGNPDRPEKARRKASEIIVEEVRRLERTLEQLLHYARPTPPSRREVDALDLAHGVIERVTHPGGPAHCVDVKLDGAAERAFVDTHQAEQILLNLIKNAAQAGAQSVVVSVRSDRDGDRVRVEVTDDGPGIDPAVCQNLFRPFVTTKQRGAGLGLAGSRRMARENGGDLRLEPSEGGARFALLLARPPQPEDRP